MTTEKERPLDVAAELARLDAPWEKRRPELIRLKRERMRAGVAPFFRGSAPLFFLRLRELLEAAPPPEILALARWLAGDAGAAAARISWCAGDVHVENFGAYRSLEGELRFGLNDFDDAIVAPIEVDVLRLATSMILAARGGGATGPAAIGLARRLLATYAQRLRAHDAAPDPGKDEIASGAVHELLEAADDRSRARFLDQRAPVKKGGRAFVASERYRRLEGPERARVLGAFERAVAGLGKEAAGRSKGYYRPIDVAARTAGLGSLGVGRFAILVEGKAAETKKDEDNVLLELKEAKPAALARYACPAEECEDEARRVVAGQTALRGEHAADLGAASVEKAAYYLRRLSHREQRVDLEVMGAKTAVLEALVEAEALALARAHGRGRAALGRPRGALKSPTAREAAAWLKLAARLAGAVEADYLGFVLGEE